MPSLKILICGGGVGGPALAFWLARAGHQVTIVERFPALRASGAQIDLRGQGIEAIKRMGLLDAVRTKLVDEPGVAMVDTNGKEFARVMANKSGKGAQSVTSEYEIMRGDLVRILYDVTKDSVRYVFGRTVDSFKQNDEGVIAFFSNGEVETFDILVGADGQGSRVRKAILPPGSPEPYNRLGIMIAYWMIPTIPSDDSMRKVYRVPSRWIMQRMHCVTEAQVYFFLRDDAGEYRDVPRRSIEEQKAFWASMYRGKGGQTDRFIAGMDSTENFYCSEVLQVKTDTWSKGRVVLLGDAAHCPSPMSGMGTTTSLCGAYLLSGEIIRHSDDIDTAFADYDRKLRPFIDEAQKISGLLKYAIPTTEWGLAILVWIMQVVCWLRIPDLVSRLSEPDKGRWKLPEYPEMETKKVQ